MQLRQDLASHQRNSLQTEQKVGWPKKVAQNSWFLMKWTLGCLKAPLLLLRVVTPSSGVTLTDGLDAAEGRDQFTNQSAIQSIGIIQIHFLLISKDKQKRYQECSEVGVLLIIHSTIQSLFYNLVLLMFLKWRHTGHYHESAISYNGWGVFSQTALLARGGGHSRSC